MIAAQPADTTEARFSNTTRDVLTEASALVVQTISAAALADAHRAEICGCPGCRAQAVQVAEWAMDMLAFAA